MIVAAGLAIAAGTYVGGWRIMRTLGQRVFNMEPASGFAAQITAGRRSTRRRSSATRSRRPTSISGAVMGAGATKRLSAVRWGVAGNIVIAWILTIPAAAIVAAALLLAGAGDLLGHGSFAGCNRPAAGLLPGARPVGIRTSEHLRGVTS